jgi:hypothetical protein
MKGVTDFTLLPDDKTAAVVFMGVSNDAKSALFFLADPGFTPNQATGDTTTSKATPKLGKGGGSTISDASDTVLPRLLDLGSVAQTK